MDPKCLTFSEFFETENALSEEIAKTCREDLAELNSSLPIWIC